MDLAATCQGLMPPVMTSTEFVAARMPSLLRTAYLLTGDHHDAQDLVQVTLIKCGAALASHLGRTGCLRAPGDGQREHLAVASTSLREVPTATPPDTVVADDEEDQGALRAALEGLAPRQRAVIVLRYFDELTEAETAAALGISVGTVKSQSRDALARLRAGAPLD